VSRGRFGVARAYLERLQAEAAPVDQEQAGWPRVLLAEIAVWEGRYDDARALVEEGLGLTADLDEPLAAASLCAVGLRAEADRADEARVLRRRQQLEQARRAGSELLDRIRELIAKPGPVDGWKREVGALAAQGEAEATRLRGGQEPDAWAAAVAAWERLGMPYPAAYCRWRQAEALLDGGGATRGRAHRLLGAAHAAAVALGAAPLRDGILWTWIPYPGIVTGPDRKGGP
jgi:tetratricopeptide (TPR) repeat protein